MHDAVLLEAIGVPACAICTEPFRQTVAGAAQALGLPEAKVVYLPHPFGTLTADAVTDLAGRCYEEILATLTERGSNGEAQHS